MQKPDLDRMWHTFIKIGLPNQISCEKIIHMIRSNVTSTISLLWDNSLINWYSFLIHDRRSGVPTTEDDDNLYFHIRVSLKKGVDAKHFRKSLPDYCVKTRKIKRKWVEQISIAKKETFNTTLFKNEKIEEVWKILGEQSEWLINFLNTFKKDIDIPPSHITIFLHYYFNMLGIFQIVVKCPECGHFFSVPL